MTSLNEEKLKRNWVIRALMIENSQFFKLCISYLIKHDCFSIIRLIDILDQNIDKLI